MASKTADTPPPTSSSGVPYAEILASLDTSIPPITLATRDMRPGEGCAALVTTCVEPAFINFVVDTKLAEVHARLDGVDTKLSDNAKLAQLLLRLDGVDYKLRTNEKLDETLLRLDNINIKLSGILEASVDADERVDALFAKLITIDNSITSLKDKMGWAS